MIESINNERVKNWAKLQDKKYINETGLFIIEGKHLVDEAKKANLLEEVILLEGETYDYTKVSHVTMQVMKKITALTNPPKIIGIARKLVSKDIQGKVLLLDNVRDPGNLGTIIRSSIAFNIDTLIIGNGSVSVYNPKVIRATEGLIFHLNIISMNIKDALEELKRIGYTIYSTDVTGGKDIRKINFSDKPAIVMGNEGKGVSEEVNKYADEFLYIDMNKNCESLNVGVATSIILYELNK